MFLSQPLLGWPGDTDSLSSSEGQRSPLPRMAVFRGIVGGMFTQIPSETPEERSHHPPWVPSSSAQVSSSFGKLT